MDLAPEISDGVLYDPQNLDNPMANAEPIPSAFPDQSGMDAAEPIPNLVPADHVKFKYYGPEVGDRPTHDVLYGPEGNALQPGDVAVSPDLASKYPLGSYIAINTPSGVQHGRVADYSYVHPGHPNHNTIEFWNRKPGADSGHIAPLAIPDNQSTEVAQQDTGDQFHQLLDQTVGATPQRALMAGDITDAAIEGAVDNTDEGVTSSDLEEAVQNQVDDATAKPSEEAGNVPLPPAPANKRIVSVSKDGQEVTYSNGVTYNKRDDSITYQAAGQQWYLGPGMKTPRNLSAGKASQKSPEDLMTEAAARKGIIQKPDESKEDFQARAEEALQGATSDADIDALADAIHEGRQPPTLQGISRTAGIKLRARLAQKYPNYNLTNAQLDYKGAEKLVATMSGPKQIALRQAVDQTSRTLDVIDSISKEWNAGDYPLLNWANLKIAQSGNMGQKAQSIANRLVQQTSIIQGELGNVLMGGGTPTDHSLKLASEALNSNWGDKTLRDLTGQLRENLNIRKQSIEHVASWAPGGGSSNYLPKPGEGQPEAQPSATPAHHIAVDDVVPSKNGLHHYRIIGFDPAGNPITKQID